MAPNNHSIIVLKGKIIPVIFSNHVVPIGVDYEIDLIALYIRSVFKKKCFSDPILRFKDWENKYGSLYINGIIFINIYYK